MFLLKLESIGISDFDKEVIGEYTEYGYYAPEQRVDDELEEG